MSRLLGRIGNVADVLLDNELKRQSATYESNLVAQRQKEASEQGVLQTIAGKMGDQQVKNRRALTEEQLAPIAAVNPRVAAMIRAQASSMPSDEQAAGDAAAPLYKEIAGAGTDEALGSENARLAQAKASFSGVNVPMKSDDNNPMWAVQDAYRAQHETIGKNEADKRAAALEDKGKEKLLPGRPEIIGVWQMDQNGKPVPNGAYVLGENGQPRPATAEDRANPDIKWHPQMPQQPGYASIYANSTPMTPDEAKYWAQRVVETGSWTGLPPMGGPAGMKNQKLVESLVPHFHSGVGWDAATPGGAAAADQSLASNKMDYDAGHRTVGELTSNIAALNSYEESAKKNGALLKTVSAQIPASSWPSFLATPVRDLARVWGDPVMRQFEVYRQSVSKEYGRITTQPTLKGVFSVQGMLDANTTMPPDATAGGLMAAVDAFDKEAHNRQSSYLEELKRQREGAVNGGAGGSNRLGGQPVAPTHRPGVVRR